MAARLARGEPPPDVLHACTQQAVENAVRDLSYPLEEISGTLLPAVRDTMCVAMAPYTHGYERATIARLRRGVGMALAAGASGQRVSRLARDVLADSHPQRTTAPMRVRDCTSKNLDATSLFLVMLWSRGHCFLRDAVRLQYGGWPLVSNVAPAADIWTRAVGACTERGLRLCPEVSPPLLRVTAWPMYPAVGTRVLETCYRSTMVEPSSDRDAERLWNTLRAMYGSAGRAECTVELYVTSVTGDSPRDTGSFCYFADDMGEAVVPPGTWVVERVIDAARGRVEVSVTCDPEIAALCAE